MSCPEHCKSSENSKLKILVSEPCTVPRGIRSSATSDSLGTDSATFCQSVLTTRFQDGCQPLHRFPRQETWSDLRALHCTALKMRKLWKHCGNSVKTVKTISLHSISAASHALRRTAEEPRGKFRGFVSGLSGSSCFGTCLEPELGFGFEEGLGRFRTRV